MTSHKHLKQLVRSRMSKTGERYTTARRQILAKTQATSAGAPHLSGVVPATTALRILLTHAGVTGPDGKRPLSEALLFTLAGGIGVGACAFLYQKEDTASLFLAGRHLWQDDQVYCKAVLQRLGIKPVVKESTGTRTADRDLRQALEAGRPVIAWVDATHLPHRAMPAHWSGGGYHVVTVYAIDGDHALVGDLGNEPVALSLADLATARGRIKKQKNRLLWIESAPRRVDLSAALRGGLGACADLLTGQKMKWFRLDALTDLAGRMHGSSGKASWEVMFPPGGRLWSAMTSLHQFIEYYGSGGGLCRPLFAKGLAEAGRAFRQPRFTALAGRYAGLGKGWSELAAMALPDTVPACRSAKQLFARKAELTRTGGKAADVAECWNGLERLSADARKTFPLTSAEAEDLRRALQAKLRSLAEGEKEAAAELRM